MQTEQKTINVSALILCVLGLILPPVFLFPVLIEYFGRLLGISTQPIQSIWSDIFLLLFLSLAIIFNTREIHKVIKKKKTTTLIPLVTLFLLAILSVIAIISGQ